MTTISAERNGLAKVGLALRRREQWGARRSYTDARTVNEPATRVFVHITITNPSNYNSRDAHARAVESIGISRFPATGISYNRMVFAGTDTIYEAQPIGRRGAHTVNDFRRSKCSTSGCPGQTASLTAPSWNLNYNARAYVICQNTQHTVTDQMVTALARAIAADAKAGFVTEYAALRPHGHRCVSAKSCPGNLMWAKMGSLKLKIATFLAKPASIGGGSGGTTIPDPSVPGTGFDPEGDWFDMATKKDLADVIDERLDNHIVKHTDKNVAWHIRLFHTLLGKPVPLQSPGVAEYARDVIGWVDPNDPTKARTLADRYLLEHTFAMAHQMREAQREAFKAISEGLSQVLGEDPTNDLSTAQWQTLLDDRLDAAFDRNVVRVDVDVSIQGEQTDAPA